MSYAYYSSGEKIDGEYHLPETGTIKKVEPELIVYPKEFDFEYYKSMRDKYNSSCPDYWEWETFRLYCKACSAMLKQVSFEFCKKYNVEIGKLNLPSFITGEEQHENLEDLQTNLAASEAKISSQFSRSNRKVQAKLNKHRALEKLRDYAALTWMLYYAVNENYLTTALKFKKIYESLNFDEDLNVIRALRGVLIMKRNANALTQDMLIDKRHNRSSDLYSSVDARAIYNDLAVCAGADGLDRYDEILEELKPRLEILKTDKRYAHLIYFYENYDYLNKLILNIDKIAATYNNWSFDRCGVFRNVEGFTGDIYAKAQSFLEIIDIIKQNITEPLFVNDVLKAEEKLKICLENARDAYVRSNVYN